MIRPAVPADLPNIAEIYDAILTREETGGPVYTNWQRGKYPTLDTARAALQAVTEEDVRTVLRQLTLSVSYLLTREEESAHA